MRSFIICTPHQILFGSSNGGGCNAWGMWRIWERRKMCRHFWRRNLRERNHLEDLGINKMIILKWI
jgi:hypothetical protein